MATSVPPRQEIRNFATNSFFTARNAPLHPLKLRTRATMRREKNRGREEKSSSRILQRVMNATQKFSQMGKINFFPSTRADKSDGGLKIRQGGSRAR